MQTLSTSFGRRPATLDQMAAQLHVRRAVEDAAKPGSNAPAAVNKWRISRTLAEIRERLGVSDRALSVLTALLSFHPETALTLPRAQAEGEGREQGRPSCDLVVFPSNRQLGQRAHGMAPATLWRHLTALVAAGLVIRRDSPNGKRYARRDASGQDRFTDAFGFDLTPLVARAAEFEAIAEQLRAAQKRRQLTKERISLLRRDVGKTIALGLDEGLPGGWEDCRLQAMTLMTPLRRIRDDAALDALEADLAALRARVSNMLESCMNAQNMMGDDHHSDEHQSISKTDGSSDLEPAHDRRGNARDALDDAGSESKSCPLGLVLEACPDVGDYAADGKVRTWEAFLGAVRMIRPMIGISPDAWREARATFGEVGAHIVVATILQRSIHSSEAEAAPGGGPVLVNGSPAIHSAGGYLRALTEKARAGEFAIGPLLMALIGQRMKAKRPRRDA